MIRDPSDGTVREKRPDDKQDGIPLTEQQIFDNSTSGLPIMKAKDLARLKGSRDWLRDFVQ